MENIKIIDPSNYALIDLHLHIDGALSPEAVVKMAEMSQTALQTNDILLLEKHLTVNANCKNLNDYLECFEIPISIMQTTESISYAVYDLVKRLDAQGLIYAELRYAPQLHTKKGLTQEEVVTASIDGLNKGLSETSIKAQLILCAMRMEDNHKANLETVQLVSQYLGQGVAALDLAGAEGLFPTEHFKSLFDYANTLDIPFTLHAGEAVGPESVDQAIDFGARRIGHGIRSIEKEKTLKALAEKGIPLEICPTSNLQTKAVPEVFELKDYPLNKLKDAGIKITINTDNPRVSGITLREEFERLFKSNLITEADARDFVTQSINAGFLSDSQKEALRKIAESRMP